MEGEGLAEYKIDSTPTSASASYSACLICLKKITLELTYRHSSKVEKCHHQLLSFLRFCSWYLQVDSIHLVKAVQLMWDGNLGHEGSGSQGTQVRLICNQCYIVLKSLEEIYRPLIDLEVKLFGRIKEVQEKVTHSEGFLRGTSKDGSGRLENISALVNLEYDVLRGFRKSFKEKCAAKTSQIFPTISLKRLEKDKKKVKHFKRKQEVKVGDARITVKNENEKEILTSEPIYQDDDFIYDFESTDFKPTCYYDTDNFSPGGDNTGENEGASRISPGGDNTGENEGACRISPGGDNPGENEDASRISPEGDNTGENEGASRISPVPAEQPILDARRRPKRTRSAKSKRNIDNDNNIGDSDGDHDIKIDLEDPDDPSYSPVGFDEGDEDEQNHKSAAEPDEKFKATHKCNQCNKVLKHTYLVSQHRIDSDHYVGHLTTSVMSKCNLCNNIYITPEHLYNHTATAHENSDMLKCSLCEDPIIMANVRELRDHLRLNHEKPEEKSHGCLYCPCTFTTAQQCHLHRLFMHADRPTKFICDEDTCPLEFTSAQDLNSHLKTDHQQVIHECSFCNIGFLSEIHLKLHKLNHIKRNKKDRVECPNCDAKYTVKNLFLTHFNKVHGKKNPVEILTCPKCKEFSTFSRKELEYHATAMHSRYTFKCSLRNCNILFPDQISLLHHRKEKHGQEEFRKLYKKGEYKCEWCDIMFKLRFELQHHKKHQCANRPHKICSECGKTFKMDRSLEDHVRKWHTKVGMLVCDLCGKEYPSKKALENHRKAVHHRRFPCEFCGKLFHNRPKLNAHTRTHTGDKFNCSWCEGSYVDINNWKAHVKRFHPEKLEEFMKERVQSQYSSGSSEVLFTFECLFCPKMFRTGSGWEEHAREKHRKEFERFAKGERFLAPGEKVKVRERFQGFERIPVEAVLQQGSGLYYDFGLFKRE